MRGKDKVREPRKSYQPVPVSDLSAEVLDPVLRKRAGMTIGLVQSWDEIVGARLASMTRPEKIAWPRRAGEDDPFEPATLVIAASGMAALRLQHEAAEVIARVNAFLGFQAVGKVRIVQKVVAAGRAPKPAPRALTERESGRLAAVTGRIEDDGLRESLKRLGANVLRGKPRGL